MRRTLIIICVFIVTAVNAQVQTDSLTQKEATKLQKKFDKELKKSQSKTQFQALPVVFFSPETDWAFGISGVYSFYFNETDSLLKPSLISPSFIYTLNQQVLSFVQFELYPNTKFNLNGNIGYFVYPYFFSGVGNNHEGDYLEWYDAKFPVIKLNLYRTMWKPSISIGLKYNFQNTDITSEPDSVLNNNVIGFEGSVRSEVGLGIKFDSRDNSLSATKGFYSDISLMWANNLFGSSYQDQWIQLDIRKYFQLSDKKDVFALQVFSEIHTGNVPFNLMAMLGGNNLMRGYRRGVYRDRQMIVYQAEFRSRLFFKHVGFALFGSIGGIGDDFLSVNKNYRYTYGAGLRIAPFPEQRYFIRLDYGIGKDTQGFYIAVGEAF